MIAHFLNKSIGDDFSNWIIEFILIARCLPVVYIFHNSFKVSLYKSIILSYSTMCSWCNLDRQNYDFLQFLYRYIPISEIGPLSIVESASDKNRSTTSITFSYHKGTSIKDVHPFLSILTPPSPLVYKHTLLTTPSKKDVHSWLWVLDSIFYWKFFLYFFTNIFIIRSIFGKKTSSKCVRTQFVNPPPCLQIVHFWPAPLHGVCTSFIDGP